MIVGRFSDSQWHGHPGRVFHGLEARATKLQLVLLTNSTCTQSGAGNQNLLDSNSSSIRLITLLLEKMLFNPG
jgi:hypothetical protein